MTTIDPASDRPVTTGPLPGWYHDPALQDGSRLRWWDGAGWSEHTRPVTAPAPPTATPAQAPSASTPGFGAARVAPPLTGTGAARRIMHNGTAWWSFGLGLVALSIVALVLVGHRNSILISTSGVIAVISGIRALRLRSLGVADALVPAVLGIVFGALSTLLMLGMVLVSA
jgi:Protein of unknown function (DUF2510)